MNQNYQVLAGGLFVGVAVALNFIFMGRAVFALNAGLIISYLLWVFGTFEEKSNRKRIVLIYTVGVVVQCFHFLEEYLTGFQVYFPRYFGYQWSDKLFVVFNLVWLLLFFAAAWGVLRKVTTAYIIVWFFALIGGIGNGLFHPVSSMLEGGYFPGLISSFFLLIVGVVLLRELTKREDTPNLG